MDWLTFLSTVISAVAWPYVALVAIKEVRGHLPAIGRAVTSVKYKDVNVEFATAVKAVAAETKIFFPKLDAELGVDVVADAVVIDRLGELAKVSSRAAITEAWELVADMALRLYRVMPRRWNHPWHFLSTEEEFVEQEILTKRQALVYEEMEHISYAVKRNNAGDMDAESVKQYIRSSQAMKAHLQSILETRDWTPKHKR